MVSVVDTLKGSELAASAQSNARGVVAREEAGERVEQKEARGRERGAGQRVVGAHDSIMSESLLEILR